MRDGLTVQRPPPEPDGDADVVPVLPPCGHQPQAAPEPERATRPGSTEICPGRWDPSEAWRQPGPGGLRRKALPQLSVLRVSPGTRVLAAGDVRAVLHASRDSPGADEGPSKAHCRFWGAEKHPSSSGQKCPLPGSCLNSEPGAHASQLPL